MRVFSVGPQADFRFLMGNHIPPPLRLLVLMARPEPRSGGGRSFTHGVIIAYTLLPLACLTLLATLTFSMVPQTSLAGDQLWAIGTAFLAICCIGALAAVRPTMCLALFTPSGGKKEKAMGAANGVRHAGHHPASPEFSSHVLHLGDRVLCAGCTGLFLGAVAAVAASIPIFYGFLGDFPLASAAFWAGFVGMAVPLLRYPLYRPGHATVRLLLSLSFVLGGLSLLTGVCFVSFNFPLAAFTLVIITFMIFARIMLSQAEHRAPPALNP